MLDLATPLPARSSELTIQPLGDGRCVVKNTRTGEYFQLGPEEYFLLVQLDGKTDAATLCGAFAQSFGQSLEAEDLEAFLTSAREQGLLQSDVSEAETNANPHREAPRGSHSPQSILNWKKSIFDPDWLLAWLARQLGFFWTRTFLILSAGSIVLATSLIAVNVQELAPAFQDALRWESLLWVWLVVGLLTALHESAHGLTCKHFGGEVHEIGVLLLYFMPCFYCNVSDAWLFPERSRRLWVSFAGVYFELFLWSLAVFVWRLAWPGSFPHYLAFLVVASAGIATLFNLNPLIKLDGYYLLSDWLEIPNLQQRATAHMKAHMRKLFWGAPRPATPSRGSLLLVFGTAAWFYSLGFLGLMLAAIGSYASSEWGLLGIVGVAILGLVATKELFQDLSAGEVSQMIAHRRKRAMLWLLAAAAAATMLCLVQIEDRARGAFRLRSVRRVELRAPVAGFLETVHFDHGDSVSRGALVVRLQVPDLADRLKRAQAELREEDARLRLLEIGARPEQVAEQRRRVAQAGAWRDLAKQDLQRARDVLDADLVWQKQRITQCQAERDAADDVHRRYRTLHEKGTISEEQLRDAQRRKLVADALGEQAVARQRAQLAQGTRTEEVELAKCEKDLSDARGDLSLMEAGTRPEELEAQRALVAGVDAEVQELEHRLLRTNVHAPQVGVISTPRLREMAGKYMEEGDLICVIEEPMSLEAEVILAEQDAARVRSGQRVGFKARILPWDKALGRVEQIALAAEPSERQGQLTVRCSLEAQAQELRPGMTGIARIETGPRPLGAILLDRLLRTLRTELWW